MTYEMQVVFKGNYVEAYSKGVKSYQTSVRLWGEITRLCEENNCFRVLGIADSEQQMSVMDSMNHQQMFRDLGITPKYQIAWAELNEKEFGRLKALETILINRGFQGKAFLSVKEAKNWLLEGL